MLLLVSGLTNEEIAEKLMWSAPALCKPIGRHILQKLGLDPPSTWSAMQFVMA